MKRLGNAGTIATMILAAGTLFAAPPADYYQTVTTQTGSLLKQELHEITAGNRGYPVTVLSYDNARIALSNTIDNVGGGNVRLCYTSELRPASEWPTDQSREHCWPQSFGADVTGPYSDVHHLRLCDAGINSTRNNRFYGNVTGGTAVSNPTGDPDDQNYYLGDLWQVAPNQRGDIARAMFYMDTRWSGLTLVDYPTTPVYGEMGYLSDLLQWAQEDPVDAVEQARNDAAFASQGNRNPFVDHPEWVAMVYSAAPVTDGDTVTVAATDIAPTTIARGGDAPMLALTVTAAANEWDTGLLVFNNIGTLADGSLTVLVYTDNNDNQIVDTGDVLLGSNSFSSGATSVILDPVSRAVPGSPSQLLAVAKVASGATVGQTTALRLAANGVFHSSTGGADVDPANAAADSGAATITAAADSGVFFSEYIEGSSNNKAVEIYNGSGSTIDLSSWKVEFYYNGNTTASTTINLTGTLALNDVYVIADNDAIQGILDVADLISNSQFYNGDDAIVLRDDASEVVDSIGQIGVQQVWGSGSVTTQNHTLRRKQSVTHGDTNPNDVYDPTIEWDGFASDTIDDLGQYQSEAKLPPSMWLFM